RVGLVVLLAVEDHGQHELRRVADIAVQRAGHRALHLGPTLIPPALELGTEGGLTAGLGLDQRNRPEHVAPPWMLVLGGFAVFYRNRIKRRHSRRFELTTRAYSPRHGNV